MHLGLTRGTPVVGGPTHFPYNTQLEPMVIDLVYIPTELSLRVRHHIHLDIWGMSDHAPLLSELPTLNFELTKFKCYLKLGTPEYTSWMEEVSKVLANLGDMMPPSTPEEIYAIVETMLLAFSKVWDSHADFVNITQNSKKWWNGSCTSTLAQYQSSRGQEDWAEFQCTTRTAKHSFFNCRIQEIAVKKAGPWDLVAWIKQHQLPSYEAHYAAHMVGKSSNISYT